MFLDVGAPSTPVLGGSCNVTPDGGTDSTDVGFSELMLDILGQSSESGELRTGQQVEVTAEEPSKDDAADTDNLLGFVGNSQGLLGVLVAEAAKTDVPVPVDTGVGEQVQGQATETIQAAGNGASDLFASEPADSWLSTVSGSTAVSETAQKTTTPIAADQQPETAQAVTAQKTQSGSSEVNTSGWEPATEADAELAANLNPDVKTGEVQTTDVKATANVVQPTTDDSVKPTNDMAPVEVGKSDDRPTASSRMARLLDELGVPKGDAQPEQPIKSSSVQPTISQGVSDEPIELKSDMASTNDAKGGHPKENGVTAQDQPQHVINPLQDVRVPTAQAVDRTEPHLPPQNVIESKMIHQIVKEAKVQLFDGGGTLTLRLDPPHLGSVSMSVSANEGVVTATLQTSTETARHALESGLGSLKQALSDAGIVVDKINVSVGGDQNTNWSAQTGAQNGRHESGSRGYSRFFQGFGGSMIPGSVFDTSAAVSNSQLDYLA